MRLIAALAAATAAAALLAALTGTALPLPTLPPRPAPPRWAATARREGVAPARLVALSIGSAAGAWFVTVALTGLPLVAAAPAAAASLAPAAVLNARAERRRRERLAAWPDALRSLVGALQAGQSLHQALIELSRTGPVPLRGVWERYRSLTDHGLPEAQALDALRRELAEPLSDRVMTVLAAATTKGSRIALRVLRDVADATAADVRVEDRIATAGVEMRLNSWTVFALPWLTLAMLCGRPGQYRDYYASGAGAGVLALGAVMSAAGMVIVRRLGRLPAEPRVLIDSPEAGR